MFSRMKTVYGKQTRGTLGRNVYCAPHVCSRAESQRDAGPARFRCFQGFSVLVANFADEAVVDVDPHHGFSIYNLLLMHDHLFNQRVQEFFGQFGDVRLLLHQSGKFLGVTALTGIVGKQGLNLIVPVFQLPGFSLVYEAY